MESGRRNGSIHSFPIIDEMDLYGQEMIPKDLSLKKLPPYSDDAEAQLLGCILFDPASISKIPFIESSDFYQIAHQKIFACMQEMLEENEILDLLTLSEMLLMKQELEAVGGPPYLMDLMEKTATATIIVSCAKIVKSKSKLRKLIALSVAISTHAYNESKTAADLIELTIDHAVKLIDIEGGIEKVDKVIPRVIENIENIVDPNSNTSGISTGFLDIDEMLSGGLHRKDLVIVAARPSMGKTSLGLDFTQNIAATGIPSVFFSLETSGEQLGMRMLCSDANVNSRDFQRGRLLETQWPKLIISAGKCMNYPIWIDDRPGVSPLYVRAGIQKLKMQIPELGLAVVDYLTLLHLANHRGNRQQEVGMIAQMLKNTAKEFDMPLVVLSQLSRACESRKPPRPIMSDLRESGEIEQVADVIMFLYRPSQYSDDREHTDIVELIVGKNRNGATGTLNLTFRKKFTKFENLSCQNEDFASTPF